MYQVNLHIHTNEMQEVCEEKTSAPMTPMKKESGLRGLEQAALDLLVKQNYSFAVVDSVRLMATDITGEESHISALNLRGDDFVVGNDYYIFASVENGKSHYIVAQNKDYDANHLVGGFHFGKNRRTNEDLQPINTHGSERGSGWESNVYDGILPNSIWTLARRPKCNPEGMVRLPSGVWVDIYQASDDGCGGLVSAHGVKPLTCKNWYEFNELAVAKGKRLLSYSEWCAMAMGSPQGLEDENTNAWSAYRNNGPQKTGYVDNAVSSIGCRDAVGNVYEWLDTFTSDPDGGEWEWYDKMPGHGQLFMAGSTGLMALIAGGHWNNGVRADTRAVLCNYYPWYVYTNVGARCACDSL